MTLRKVLLAALPYIVILLAVLYVFGAVNRLWSWLPFSLESRFQKAEAGRVVAVANAQARSLEVTGQADQAARVDTYSHLVITTQTAAAQAMAEARSAPDASQPINPAMLDRLRSVVDRLCDSSPRSCPTAPAGTTGVGDAALHPDRPAGERDPG